MTGRGDRTITRALNRGARVYDVHGRFHLVIEHELGEPVVWQVEGGHWRALPHLRVPRGADEATVEALLGERFDGMDGPRPGIRRLTGPGQGRSPDV